jgi:hypothetical protein
MKQSIFEISLEHVNPIANDTVDIFIPAEIKKRGGTAMIITPKNMNQEVGIMGNNKYGFWIHHQETSQMFDPLFI